MYQFVTYLLCNVLNGIKIILIAGRVLMSFVKADVFFCERESY